MNGKRPNHDCDETKVTVSFQCSLDTAAFLMVVFDVMEGNIARPYDCLAISTVSNLAWVSEYLAGRFADAKHALAEQEAEHG